MGLGLGILGVKSEWDQLQDKLNQQQQVLNVLKPTVFQALNAGRPLEVIDYLKNNPLLALVQDDKYGSNLLMAAIFNLSNTKEPNKRAEFIQLINYIIDKTQFDIRVSNSDGSTALHQIFWYAITKPQNDPEFRKQLTDLGLKLIERIKESKNFLAIMSQQNKYQETFLANIDIEPHKLSHNWQKENMQEVQKVVYPVLQKYAVKDTKKAEIEYKFSTKEAFIGHIEEILKDAIMLDVMEEPVLLTTSGHSISKTSWEGIVDAQPYSNTYPNPITKEPTAKHEVYPNQNLKKVIEIYNKHKNAGSEKLYEALEKHLKKYEGPAKALVYNDLALRGVISLVSQYKKHKEQELLKKPQEEQKKKEEQPKVTEYKRIDWMKPSFPPEVNTHPLWAFHQALEKTPVTTQEFDRKKYWALASIKSLIEIDINRKFVIEAGLAYERDVDKGIYVETSPDSGIYHKKPGAKSEFDDFRAATGNAVSGDNNKADTLRTSQMIVTPNGKRDFVSFHPSISYPTGNIKNNEEQRRASKEQQIDYFYNGLLQIWKRIDALPNPSSKQKCLNVFCEHIKIDGVGCANERLGNSIDKITQELIQHEQKQVTESQMLFAIQSLMEALGAQPQGNTQQLFDQLLKQYSGYILEGESWVIGEDTKKQFAEKIIHLGIHKMMILDEDAKDTYMTQLTGTPPKLDKEIPQPYPISDDGNYVIGVEKHNDGYKINGRNNSHEPRFIIIDKDGGVTGYNGSNLGTVEQEMFQKKEAIFKHFGIQAPKVEPVKKSDGADTQKQKEAAEKLKQQEDLYQKSVATRISKIDEALKTLQTKIGGINQHHFQEAADKAKELLTNLKGYRDEYHDALLNKKDPKAAGDQFSSKCEQAINGAKEVLEKDLGWGDYLGNLLKTLVNAVVWTVTLGNVNAFFPYNKPGSIDAIEEAEQNLKPGSNL